MRRLCMILGVVALLGLPRLASAHELCFADKTPYCMEEPFSDYWEANGGLPVFGYPIAAAADERNADTGQTYLTQWVERNRMEAHPENVGTPYAVLLGLLGKERLAQIGRSWQSEPREVGPRDGCLWFEQTGHNVCNQSGTTGFKRYWETHGLKVPGLDAYARSLQLFGLPLTEPQLETNSSGDTVLTQWFERARFEWHPANADEFKVLLGLLGKEVRAGGGLQPEPMPSPTPVVEPLPTPAPLPPSFNDCAVDPNAAPNWPVQIIAVKKSGAPETVTLKNVSTEAVDLNGWKICSVHGNQLHATLGGVLAPGAVLVVNSQASGPIWNNSEDDDGTLYDNQGRLISFWEDPTAP